MLYGRILQKDQKGFAVFVRIGRTSLAPSFRIQVAGSLGFQCARGQAVPRDSPLLIEGQWLQNRPGG